MKDLSTRCERVRGSISRYSSDHGRKDEAAAQALASLPLRPR